MGLWFNYGDINGYDFWNNSANIAKSLKGPFGKIVFKRIENIANNKTNAVLEVVSEWQKDTGEVLMEENTKFVFSVVDDEIAIDRNSTLLAKEQITFTDNKEGLFALRVSRELEQPSEKPEKYLDSEGKTVTKPSINNKDITGIYNNSNGKTGDAVFATQAKWASLNGKINTEKITLVIMDYPQNTGYPAHWFARGYGLFATNNLGFNSLNPNQEKFILLLKKDEQLAFKHRLLIISNETLTKTMIDERFAQFIKTNKE